MKRISFSILIILVISISASACAQGRIQTDTSNGKEEYDSETVINWEETVNEITEEIIAETTTKQNYESGENIIVPGSDISSGKVFFDGEEVFNNIYIRIKPGSTHEISLEGFEKQYENITYEWFVTDSFISEQQPISIDNNILTSEANCNQCYSCTIKSEKRVKEYISIYLDVENHFRLYPEGYINTDYDQRNRDWMYTHVSVPVDAVEYEFSAIALADDDEITYQWYRYGFNEGADYVRLEGETSSRITIPVNAQETVRSMARTCKATDKYGNYRMLEFKPRWENHFSAVASGTNGRIQMIYAEQGETIDLAVTVYADDMDDITYKWTKNDLDINENEPVLKTDQITEFCRYICFAKDKFGTERSVTFYIYPYSDIPVYNTNQEIILICESGESLELQFDLPEEIIQQLKERSYVSWYIQQQDGRLHKIKDYNALCYWFCLSGDGMHEDCVQLNNDKNNTFSFKTPPITGETVYRCYIMDPNSMMDLDNLVLYTVTFKITPD